MLRLSWRVFVLLALLPKSEVMLDEMTWLEDREVTVVTVGEHAAFNGSERDALPTSPDPLRTPSGEVEAFSFFCPVAKVVLDEDGLQTRSVSLRSAESSESP